MVGLVLGCSLVIIGEGDGQDYPVTIGMLVEVEINLVELLVNGWELKRDNGKRNCGGD
jgi:hypothetical protein